MNLLEIYDLVKKNFCELTSYKVRGEVLEVITAFSTMNNKFVSVFIKEDKNKLIVTDNGWVDLNVYETPIYEETEEITKRVIMSYANSFDIKSIDDKTGVRFYYKTCGNNENLSGIVFDVASFIVGAVNAFCIHYMDAKEEKERETFRKDANNFLSVRYNQNVKFRQPLDDFKNIKFSAIVTHKSELYLISYITGSSISYFDNDIRRTIVNYEIAIRSKYNVAIKERISLINNKSDGYNTVKSSSILGLLSEKTTRKPVT
ncbi:MAG: hypothetical protein ABSA76_15800, partial [Bacteroidales bacterium]